MNELSVLQMEEINGGGFWSCAAGLVGGTLLCGVGCGIVGGVIFCN